MTHPTPALPLIAIESKHCPKCQGPMMLARIVPGRLNFDLRTFECVKCDHVQKVLTATDPMADYGPRDATDTPCSNRATHR